MQAKLILTFERFNESDFHSKAGLIATSLSGNPHYPEPWPAQVPSLALLQKTFESYSAAYLASAGHDTAKIAIREAARQELTALLKKLVPYLEMVADGDVSILLSTGYDLRRDSVQTSTGAHLGPPVNVKLVHGDLSGVLSIKARSLPGAGSYEVSITDGDPTVAESWKDAGTFLSCSHIELEGLAPGKTYSVRLRGIGSNGPGAWTPAMSLMVI